MKIWVILISLAIGCSVGYVLKPNYDVDYHWMVVNRFRDILFDPSQWEFDPRSKLYHIDGDKEFPVSLEALVVEGELKRAELIFPTIPYTPEVVKVWMNYCDKHKHSIMDASARPGLGNKNISGDVPFNCTVYFLPGQKTVVDDLVSTIEGMGQ